MNFRFFIRYDRRYEASAACAVQQSLILLYKLEQRDYDMEIIQKLFNHSSPSVTLRYIGITQDNLDDVYMSLDL